MNTLQILKAIRSLGRVSMGVFPADHLPMRWTHPAAMIVNTDIHTKPGSHWVAMYLDDKGCCTYFDSYGTQPLIPTHIERIRKNSRTYIWNTQQIQSYGSTVCGQFCIMFLYYMKRGYSLEKFCKLFSQDYKRNDRIATRFYNRIKNVKKNFRVKKSYSLHKGYGKLCIQNCKPRYICMS